MTQIVGVTVYNFSKLLIIIELVSVLNCLNNYEKFINL